MRGASNRLGKVSRADSSTKPIFLSFDQMVVKVMLHSEGLQALWAQIWLSFPVHCVDVPIEALRAQHLGTVRTSRLGRLRCTRSLGTIVHSCNLDVLEIWSIRYII